MCVSGGISRGSSQTLALLVRNVLSVARIPVPFGKTEIYGVDDVLFLAHPRQEVVWLDISVQEVLLMHVLHPLHELVSDHEDRLDRELSFAIFE